MAYDKNMRQHQNMARGNGIKSSGDSCGCESLASVNGGPDHPDRGMAHTPMDDNSRAGPPHISRGSGKLPATAHSDHGPHHTPG